MRQHIDTVVARPGNMAEAEALEWNSHPVFAGVALKHLIVGADTGGSMSVHLVRVDAGCEIGQHVHEGCWETHQVLAGTGECVLDSCTLAYRPGMATVMPRGEAHRVVAAGEPLLLLATFAPALL